MEKCAWWEFECKVLVLIFKYRCAKQRKCQIAIEADCTKWIGIKPKYPDILPYYNILHENYLLGVSIRDDYKFTY